MSKKIKNKIVFIFKILFLVITCFIVWFYSFFSFEAFEPAKIKFISLYITLFTFYILHMILFFKVHKRLFYHLKMRAILGKRRLLLLLKRIKIFFYRIYKYGGSAVIAAGVTLFFTTIMNISDNLIQKSSDIELAKLGIQNQSIIFEKEYKLRVLREFSERYEVFYKEYFLDKVDHIYNILDGKKLSESDINDINEVFNEGYLEKSYLIRITNFFSFSTKYSTFIIKPKEQGSPISSYWGGNGDYVMSVFERHLKYCEEFNEYLIKKNLDRDYIRFTDTKADKEKIHLFNFINKMDLVSERIKMDILDIEHQLLKKGQD